MALPKVIATIRSTGPIGVIGVNPVTNQVYFINSGTDDGSVGVLDAAANQIITRIRIGRLPSSLSINPRKNRIYVPNFRDSTLSVINGRSNRVLSTTRVGFLPDTAAASTRTGQVYVTSAAGTVSVVDGVTNKVRKTLRIGGRPSQIVIDERTNRVYITNTVQSSVTVVNGRTQSILATIKVGRNPVILPALNPATQRLYVANNLSRFLSVVDCRTNKLLRNIPLGRLQSEVTLNPRTKRVYVSSAQVEGAGKLFVLSGTTHRVSATLALPTSSNMLINPATNHLFISDLDKGRMLVYHAGSLKRIAILPHVTGNMALNPRTNRIYVGSDNVMTVIQDGRSTSAGNKRRRSS